MNRFEHFIITRFNLLHPDWKKTKNGELVLSESWLTNRFNLFENFNYPSVKSQTNKKFQWLIFFDERTPQNFRQRIKALAPGVFNPYFVDGMSAFLPTIKSILSQSKAEYIISSRIDNDDILHEKYVQWIQERFQPMDFMSIDFPYGYSLDISTDRVKLGYHYQQNNPFISLIEQNTSDLQSVWSFNHADWKRHSLILRDFSVKPWMSIIHSENKANLFEGFGQPNFDRVFQHFKINPKVETQLRQNYIPEKQWLLLSFKNRIQLVEKYYWSAFKNKYLRKPANLKNQHN